MTWHTTRVLIRTTILRKRRTNQSIKSYLFATLTKSVLLQRKAKPLEFWYDAYDHALSTIHQRKLLDGEGMRVRTFSRR